MPPLTFSELVVIATLKGFIALAFADAVTGLLHYIEDHHDWFVIKIFSKWGLREIVIPNRVHHEYPSEMTKGDWWERVRISVFMAAPVTVLAFIIHSPMLLLFALFASQANQVHYYAHIPPQQRPQFIKWLQDAGILQSMRHHARHHKPPYSTRFCVITPWINSLIELVDRTKQETQ